MINQSTYVQAYCLQCASPRYRSIRPLVLGQDKLSPDLFRAIDIDGPPPGEGEVACYICKGILRFIKEPGTVTPIRAHGQVAPLEEKVAPAPEAGASPAVRELFRVGTDEKILEMRESRNNGILVITNQRIVEVTL